MENLESKRKLSYKKILAVIAIVVLLSLGIFIRSHSFINVNDLKVTINQNVRHEISGDILTIYIPINAQVKDYKILIGKQYFQNEDPLASKMVQSLDTSLPFELVGTVVVDKTPLTLQLIVE